jgi:hypothetical protein
MRKLLLAAMLVLLLGTQSGVAFAHVLKTDNGVSAVLHIDPDDNPIAGVPTTLSLTYGTDKGSFQLGDCSCGVRVIENNKGVATTHVQPAYFGSAAEGNAIVTFPDIGIYNVIVSGSAADHSIPTFSMNYLVRVASSATSTTNKSNSQIVIISLASLIAVGIVAKVQIERGNRYKQVKPKKGTKYV